MKNQFFLAVFFSMFAVHAFGQMLKGLKCNSHTISDLIRAYDTTACSLDFYIVNSQDQPLDKVTVIVERMLIKIQGSEIYSTSNPIELKTDNKGYCGTNLFHGTVPLKIKLKDKLIKYEFEFSKSLNGYGYDNYIKLCD